MRTISRLELRHPRGHDVRDLGKGNLRGTDRDQPEVTLASVPVVTDDIGDRDQLPGPREHRDVVDRGNDPTARLGLGRYLLSINVPEVRLDVGDA